MAFDNCAPKEVKSIQDLEEEKKHDNKDDTDDILIQKSNLIGFMDKMNLRDFNSFFKTKFDDDIIPLDIKSESIRENEKELLEKEEIKSIMLENTLIMIKETTIQNGLYSLSGQIRKESIRFYDHDHNEIQYKEKDPISILFVNNTHKEIIVISLFSSKFPNEISL